MINPRTKKEGQVAKQLKEKVVKFLVSNKISHRGCYVNTNEKTITVKVADCSLTAEQVRELGQFFVYFEVSVKITNPVKKQESIIGSYRFTEEVQHLYLRFNRIPE